MVRSVVKFERSLELDCLTSQSGGRIGCLVVFNGDGGYSSKYGSASAFASILTGISRRRVEMVSVGQQEREPRKAVVGVSVDLSPLGRLIWLQIFDAGGSNGCGLREPVGLSVCLAVDCIRETDSLTRSPYRVNLFGVSSLGACGRFCYPWFSPGL